MGLFDILKKKPKINAVKSDVLCNEQLADSSKKTEVSAQPQVSQPSDTELTSDGIPTLESRIKQAYSSRTGLFPHEILMLEYAGTYKTRNNTFQNFWKWEYSVYNPQLILDSLLERGYIHPDLKTTLKHMVVADLKKILSKIGEKTTGRKQDLIDRIIATYSLENLNKEFPIQNYALTEKGEDERKANEYVIYLHRTRYMSVWDMNKELYGNNPTQLGYRDLVWRFFNKQSSIHFQNFDFGLYIGTRYNMHSFLIEEGRLKDALKLLIEVLSFELSGLGNNDEPISLQDSEVYRKIRCKNRMINLFTKNENDEYQLMLGRINAFEKLYQELKMPTDEFIPFVYELFSKISIHERVFDDKECANIVLSEIGLEIPRIKNYYEVFKSRLMTLFQVTNLTSWEDF